MNFTKITTIAAVSLMLGACASTSERSYEPAEKTDFVYDNSKSFAMNVVDGSLGFHTGLEDAEAAKGSSATAGVIDTLGASYLGFMANGFAGGLLGMMSGAGTNAPLDSGFGIYYVPVKAHDKANLDVAFSYIDQQIIKATESSYNVKFVKAPFVSHQGKKFVFSGEYCKDQRTKYAKAYEMPQYKLYELTADDMCLQSGYSSVSLMKYATTTPDGKAGDYAVIGVRGLGFTKFPELIKLEGDFYYFQPKQAGVVTIPFVYHNDKASFFVNPKTSAKSDVTVHELGEIYPKLFTSN